MKIDDKCSLTVGTDGHAQADEAEQAVDTDCDDADGDLAGANTVHHCSVLWPQSEGLRK